MKKHSKRQTTNGKARREFLRHSAIAGAGATIATTLPGAAMAEVLFYHLERQPLDRVLPELLEKCLQRDWRAVVQLGSEERLEALDSHLWTYRDDAFLPHGTAADGHVEAQPVYLTDGEENPNGAVVRFLVDRASPPDLTPYQRGVFLFDGQDPEAVADARRHWKAMKEAGQLVEDLDLDTGQWVYRAQEPELGHGGPLTLADRQARQLRSEAH